MLDNNTDLPQKFQNLFKNMQVSQAVPLGSDNNNIPYVGIKVSQEDMTFIDEQSISAEFKPTILNVDIDDFTVAILFVQFKLNNLDNFIFTLTYDLKNDKHLTDASMLLKMQSYNLIIATETEHKILSFTTEFEADFEPIEILASARANATSYEFQLFHQLTHFLSTSHNSPSELWKHFDEIAPLERSWYARLQMQK